MLYTTFLTVYKVSPNATSLKMVVFLRESGDFSTMFFKEVINISYC